MALNLGNGEMAIDPRILGKIKKCLALAASSNANEAATALRQAQKMMEQHNVDQTTVELGVIATEEVDSICTSTKIKPWEGDLANIVRSSFGLELLWNARTGRFGAFMFIGPEHDLALGIWTFTHIRRCCMKARQEFMDQRKADYADFNTSVHNHITKFSATTFTARSLEDLIAAMAFTTGKAPPTPPSTADGDSFACGWIRRVSEQLEAFARPRAHAEAITKKAHTMANQDAVAKQQKDVMTKEELVAGYEAAADFKLHRPMTDESEKQKMIGGVS